LPSSWKLEHHFPRARVSPPAFAQAKACGDIEKIWLSYSLNRDLADFLIFTIPRIKKRLGMRHNVSVSKSWSSFNLMNHGSDNIQNAFYLEN
jgi:hypothetical protein